MDDQSHWHNSCTFKASLFPLIYYNDRKERLLHLLFQLIFLFELVALYLEQLLYQELVCFIVMIYSLYLGLVRCFVTEFFCLWIELLSCWLFTKVNSEMLSGLAIVNPPCQASNAIQTALFDIIVWRFLMFKFETGREYSRTHE